MKVPIATYRLQLFSGFGFQELKEILDYLEQLGISTIYASPFFEARRGSTHGYDNTDPLKINPEIGTLEEFREIRKLLDKKKMSWIQDIVPNHMAFDPANPWIRDILELGVKSHYYQHFDIDWNYKELDKIMAPFLGELKEEVIKKGQIKLDFGENAFVFRYFENSYPVNLQTYSRIFEELEEKEWKKKFRSFSGTAEELQRLKAGLWEELDKNPVMKHKISKKFVQINSSHNSIREILQLQKFVPVYWRTTENEINYRRFFTINHLICLRMEDKKVFKDYHGFIKKLVEEELINGLRIDHIDGLFDPLEYLQRLRKNFGKDAYLVVEKILEKYEELPAEWPVEGSTGYEFLAQVNQLLTAKKNETKFTEFYKALVPELSGYEQIVFQKKQLVLESRMNGELQNLYDLLDSGKLLEKNDFEGYSVKKALGEILAGFPVYRIYPQQFPLKENEKQVIEEAVSQALKYTSEDTDIFTQLKAVLLGESDADEDKSLYFLQRCQQFTGPLAAKGVEDTSFYIYNRLISHNEVGDSPEGFGISTTEFHQKMFQRLDRFPLAMNASATHDTKKGEDSRMRLNVLSEIPDEFFRKVKEWQQLNGFLKKRNIPDANEEYFLYQSLLAVKAFGEETDFIERTKAYMQKALRETKVNSSWASPDESYETTVLEFVEAIWENREFRTSFDPFMEKVSYYGCLKSLGQVVLKSTAPGLPDVYQGTELWEFNYVDPDNRRAVDYELRKKYLTEIKLNKSLSLSGLKGNYQNGKIKLYVLNKLLELRKADPKLFFEGDYIPVELEGRISDGFIAYFRKYKKRRVLVVLALEVTKVFDDKGFIPVPEETYILLTEKFPKKWKNILSGVIYEFGERINVTELLKEFPIVVLKTEG
ncbi:malto-oligosyltrehalose synthase [Salegentibacter chungangensis]|uniref:Malto-oligosyltrehalose synthase n=1 Tax=Salegentibacter chungangensis TaxID=1335724 RepID=A0ABW3NT70_9FLAO